MDFLWLILLNPVALIILIILAAQLILGPIIVYLNQRIPVEISYDYPTAGITESDPQLKNFIEQRTAEFLLHGFNFVTVLASNTSYFSTQSSRTFMVVLQNPESKAVALCFSIRAETQDNIVIKSGNIDIQTQLSNGRSVVTAANNDAEIFFHNPQVISERFRHDKTNVEQLCEIHHFMVKHLGDGTPVESFISDPIAELKADGKQTMKYQADHGLVRLSPDHQSWRPTIFGAIWMTWRLIQPVKSLVMFHMWIRRNQLLRRLHTAEKRSAALAISSR